MAHRSSPPTQPIVHASSRPFGLTAAAGIRTHLRKADRWLVAFKSVRSTLMRSPRGVRKTRKHISTTAVGQMTEEYTRNAQDGNFQVLWVGHTSNSGRNCLLNSQFLNNAEQRITTTITAASAGDSQGLSACRTEIFSSWSPS